MTRKIQNELDAERALRILYGDGLRDFSPRGYLKAMGELRKVDPTLARRVERFLAPKLDEIFPRRRRPWHETSEGVRARLELLPSNPHCELDVHAAREALGIPPDQIKASPSESDLSKIEASLSAEDIRRTVERHLAGLWVYLHTATANGDTAAVDLIKELPQALQESAIASADVDLKSAAAEWLRRPPQGPEPYNDSSAPIHWVAGRLIESTVGSASTVISLLQSSAPSNPPAFAVIHACQSSPPLISSATMVL